jgi:hypothetical protein
MSLPGGSRIGWGNSLSERKIHAFIHFAVELTPKKLPAKADFFAFPRTKAFTTIRDVSSLLGSGWGYTLLGVWKSCSCGFRRLIA